MNISPASYYYPSGNFGGLLLKHLIFAMEIDQINFSKRFKGILRVIPVSYVNISQIFKLSLFDITTDKSCMTCNKEPCFEWCLDIPE